MTFEKLGISRDIVRELEEIGITHPVPVQEKSIPLLLKGMDVICQSETGSGKTLAFSIPIVERTFRKSIIQAIVLAPTRELANQIMNDIRNISKGKRLNIVNVYGGVSIEGQIRDLMHADIVIGTPGRMLDHIRRNTINLSHVSFLVLDEADRMLEMGFIDDVEQIIRRTPRKRQTMLFSATMPPEIAKLSRRYMISPRIVRMKRHVEKELLRQYYCDVLEPEKFSALVHILKKENPQMGIIFCERRVTAEAVAHNLSMNGIKNLYIHGKLSQNVRDKIMSDFRHGRINLLVATDLASRGLDISGITHIFNYNIPEKSKDYIHRIGRTARAGKKGKVISIISPKDHEAFRRVLTDPEIDVEKLDIGRIRRIPFQSRGSWSRRTTHNSYKKRYPRKW